MFRIPDATRVVYLDSDILCCGNVRELFETESGFAACGDRCHYDPDLVRPKSTFGFTPASEAQDHGPLLPTPFNAGVLSVGQPFLNSSTYDELLAEIRSDVFKDRLARLADQIILNLFFEDKLELLDARFNYNLSIDNNHIFDRDRVSLSDARLIHFAGRYKPWDKEVPETAAIAEAIGKWKAARDLINK